MIGRTGRSAWYRSMNMITLITAALVVVLLSNTLAQCPPGGPDLEMSSVFSLAKNILLGRDVTPTEQCSFGDLKFCRRRQIKLEVFCTLKKTDNFSPQPTYFIGENRPVELCDATYMDYNSRNDIVIVLVTYKKTSDGQGFLDWDEEQGQKAIYNYNEVTSGPILNSTCGLEEFVGGGSSDGFCPPQAPVVKCHNRYKNLLTVVFHTDKEDTLGTQCCRELQTSKTDVSVSDTSTNAMIPSLATSEQPSVYLGTLRDNFFLGSSEALTVAMVTTQDNDTIVHWLVANVRFSSDGRLQVEDGLTIVSYSEVLPEVRSIEGQLLVFRQSVLVQDGSYPLCSQACKMNIGQWWRDNMMTVFSSTKMKVTMDHYAVWNLIKYKNHLPREVCREFDSTLDAYKNTVLCPKAAAGGATSQKLFPVSLWCFIVLGCFVLRRY